MSHQLENEIDLPKEITEVFDLEWEKKQQVQLEEDKKIIQHSLRRPHQSFPTICFNLPNRTRRCNPLQFIRKDTSMPQQHQTVFEFALLWQPQIVYTYLKLIESFNNAKIKESACGAINSLAECSWKVHTYYS